MQREEGVDDPPLKIRKKGKSSQERCQRSGYAMHNVQWYIFYISLHRRLQTLHIFFKNFRWRSIMLHILHKVCNFELPNQTMVCTMCSHRCNFYCADNFKTITDFPIFQMPENNISRKINISDFIAHCASPAYKENYLKILHKKNILELQIFCHIWCFIRVPIAHCASHFRFFEMQCTLCNSHFQNFSFWKLT